jgi:hypothetical protein
MCQEQDEIGGKSVVERVRRERLGTVQHKYQVGSVRPDVDPQSSLITIPLYLASAVKLSNEASQYLFKIQSSSLHKLVLLTSILDCARAHVTAFALPAAFQPPQPRSFSSP